MAVPRRKGRAPRFLASPKYCQGAGRFTALETYVNGSACLDDIHRIAKLAITGRLPFLCNTEILKFANFVIDQSSPIARQIAPSSIGQYDPRTEWHRIVVWRNLTKFAQTLKKGEHVYISDELRYRQYEKEVGNGKDTFKMHVAEIHATEIRRLDPRTSEDGAA